MSPIKRALISVYDKTGLEDFARQLVQDFGIEILSTGGTARKLAAAGIPYTSVSDFTESPEMFGGRVKTLHPRIHGGILMRRDYPQDQEDATKNQILPIDMVVCNLYPFHEVIKKAETDLNQALEMIDIGGPTQIRAAAKSFPYVTVIPHPSYYPKILQEMAEQEGKVTEQTRMQLAQDVFTTMSLYDSTISAYLQQEYNAKYQVPTSSKTPETVIKVYRKLQQCRYGENWDQEAAYFQDLGSEYGLHNLEQLHGKAISFNNWLDIDSCMQVLLDYQTDHAKDFICAIFKHTTPNGIAIDFKSQLEATKHAFSCDPLSAFGGIWGYNTPLTAEVADYIINDQKVFVEVLLAPEFDADALEILKTKENLRIIRFGDILSQRSEFYRQPELRSVLGGVLMQEYDSNPIIKKWDLVTNRTVSEHEKGALIFAYRACKWAKSNSAVFAKEYDTGYYTIGIGAGQQSRVHVVKLAANKATEFGHDLKDSVMGTDSFFPFPDGLEVAADKGCKAIIQPGGSIRDQMVIDTANTRNVAMVFCGKRVFRH